MAKEIVMPQMGAEMEEGTLLRWLKRPGELIKRGDEIAEIETDKANVNLESFEEGYFLGGVIPEGTKAPVGTLIGYLGEQGEQLPQGASPQAPAADAAVAAPPGPTSTPAPGAPDTAAMLSQTEPAARPEGQPLAAATDAMPVQTPAAATQAAASNGAVAAPEPATDQPSPDGRRLRVSPVARVIASELGVDLARVHGSGPDGRIMRRDVEEFARAQAQTPAQVQAAPARPAAAAAVAEAPAAAPVPTPDQVQGAAAAPPAAAAAPVAAQKTPAAAAPQPAPIAGEVVPLTRMRQAIARRMALAKREAPHYYLTASVDMTDALALRRQVNAALAEDERVSVNDLIVKACAIALERHPQFNATFSDEGLRLHGAINIGIAVALPDGLVVPAILNCGGKSLGAIARESRAAAERARSGHLRAAELTDGTFTVSNLGMYGVETLIAIIQPGQSAILGVGKVEPRPVVRDGEIVAREMMVIALSADHRVTDGAQGAQFLAEIRDLIEQPMRLVL